MARKKNKTDLREILLSSESEQDDFWFDDFSEWDDLDNYDYYWYDDIQWKYIDDEIPDNRGVIIGKFIDMQSIYSKENLRQKRIDFLLGLPSELRKPTFADIWKKSK